MKTPKFKVGDKVRRIKESHMGMGKGDTAKIIGWGCLDTVKLDVFDGEHSKENLELVEEPSLTVDRGNAFSLIKEMEEYSMTTISNFAKRLLDKNTQALIKAGYMNECLELTSKGREALELIAFVAYKDALVAAAEADIKEAEAKK